MGSSPAYLSVTNLIHVALCAGGSYGLHAPSRYNLRRWSRAVLTTQLGREATPLQHVIQACQQMRNSLLALIPHVRKAKGLTSDLAVTGINDQMMFFTQPSGSLQNINAPVVFHAGKRLSPKPLLGKEIEARSAHPVVYERICACVSSVTRFQTFRE